MSPNIEPASAVSPHPAIWLFSWPLIVGLLVYLLSFFHGTALLGDSDTYLHVATGQWILGHGTVPATDPFSHSMPGAPWVAHEWLAGVLLALAHRVGSWTGVVALAALCYAASIALLMRTLQRTMEPVYALLFAALAVSLSANHLLARPHILAMPIMMLWAIELVRASEAHRAPGLWLLPLMTLWANLHGGFTLGLALAGAFALEALLASRQQARVGATARAWGLFLLLATASTLLTPYGAKGILFVGHLFSNSSYALQMIAEWRPTNFQRLQPLEIWILAGFALLAWGGGLRLPPLRLLLVLGLLHLALKHNRSSELLGLLSPLFIATPLAAQWRGRQMGQKNIVSLDRVFYRLAQPAGPAARVLTLALLLSLTIAMQRLRPFQPPASVAPTEAIQIVQDAGIRGPVLNGYDWGGYLIYRGISPFIDGRADMYGDAFLRAYVSTWFLEKPESMETLLEKYRIAWTLMPPGTAVVSWLDRLPGWQRLHTDKEAVVHIRVPAAQDKRATEPPATKAQEISPPARRPAPETAPR